MSDYPYPGLRPFERYETDIFYGRDHQTNQLLERLDRSHFLAVLGPSGCGKSSLVRTGLLAGLEGGLLAKTGARWTIAEMRPGDDPFGRLAEDLVEQETLGAEYAEPFTGGEEACAFTLAGLARSRKGLIQLFERTQLPKSTRLLLVVDQFEELFRYHQEGDSEVAAAFVDLLLESSRHDSIYVVLTMRSDFLGDCALYRGLPEAINQGLYLTPRLDRQQLHEAIAYPAKVFGGQVEPLLVNQLVNTVGHDPDQLPLLQHTLMRLWQHASMKNPQTPHITLEAYDQFGGLQQALSDHADSIYNSLDSAQQHIAETMFRALTERETDGRDIRRPLSVAQVAELAEVDWQDVVVVAQQFRGSGRHFLTPPLGTHLDAESILDISHESLIRQWLRLQKWVEQESRMAEEYRRLSENTSLNREGKVSLLQSPALENFLEWRQHFNPGTVWAQRYGGGLKEALEYLEKSAENKMEENRKREEARERELQANRKYRLLFKVALFVAVVAICASFWAGLMTWEAKQTEERAKVNLVEAEHNLGLALYEKAKSEKSNKLAHLFGLYSLTKLSWDKDPQLYYQVVEEVQANPVRLPVFRTPRDNHHKGSVNGIAFSPDGTTLASGSSDKTIGIWDFATGHRLQTLKGHGEGVHSVAFSPDGRTLASGFYDKTVGIWDLATGHRLQTLEGHGANVYSVAFSPDGRTLVSGSYDNTFGIWDLTTGELLQLLEKNQFRVTSVTFSPDGKTLAFGSYKTVVIWDLATGKRLKTLEGHRESVNSVAFSPDGMTLASGSTDKTIGIWDLATGKRLQSNRGCQGNVYSIAFSPDGKTLASGSSDNTVGIWDLATGNRLETLEGYKSFANRIVFSTDGKAFASASSDKTIGIYELATGNLLHTLKGHVGIFSDMAFSPDNTTLALTVSEWVDDTIGIWDLATGNSVQTLVTSAGSEYGIGSSVSCIAFSPDGKTLATGLSNKTIVIWELATGERLHTLNDLGGAVHSVAFSPDGKKLAFGSSDKTIGIWELPFGILDFTTGKRHQTLEGHEDAVTSVTFSPDGKTLASGSSDNTVGIWDLATGNRLETLEGHEYAVTSVAFSPDGKTFASGSSDKTICIWDLATDNRLQTLEGNQFGVRSVAFLPDGKTLAVYGYSDRSIDIWDLLTGHRLQTLEGDQFGVQHSVVLFSPDGKTIAVYDSSDRSIGIWDLATGNHLRTLEGDQFGVRRFVFSPDGKILAAYGFNNKTIGIWDLATGNRLQTLAGDQFNVRSVVFSPDGEILAVSGSDSTIGIWDLATGNRLQILKGHGAVVNSVAFSPDGKVLVSGSSDKTICIWDLATTNRLQILKGHEAAVNSVAFSPDGKALASGSSDKTIGIWGLAINNTTEWTGLSYDKEREYTFEINRLPYHLEGVELVPTSRGNLFNPPPKPVQWGKHHPLHWLSRAESGESKAMLKLGLLYDRAKGYPRAINWYRLAAEGGDKQEKERSESLLQLAEKKYGGEGEKKVNDFLDNKKIDKAIAVYQKVLQIAPGFGFSPDTLNELCWSGSLTGKAEKVIGCCEKALEPDKDKYKFRDSRGLARALTGDRQGAIKDFEFAVENVEKYRRAFKKERQSWIRQLNAGENPFTEEKLQELRGY